MLSVDILLAALIAVMVPLYHTIFFSLFFFVVLSISAIQSLIFLVGGFWFAGFFFYLLGFEYFGLVYIIIYVGAIAVLFLFVIMLLDLRHLINIRFSLLVVSSFVIIVFGLTAFLFCFFDVWGLFIFFLSPDIEPLRITSQLFFHCYSPYIVGCGSILLVIMVGVVVLLRETVFMFYFPTIAQRNKLLKTSKSVIRKSSLWFSRL